MYTTFPVCDDPALLLEHLHVIGEELDVVAVDLDWEVLRPVEDVVIAGNRAGHVLRLRQLAPAELSLRTRSRRGAEPVEREADDENGNETKHENRW